MSPVAARKPLFTAAPLPEFRSCSTTRMPGMVFRISRVWSFEPSSTTTISRSTLPRSTALTRSIVSAMVASSLYAGITTDNFTAKSLVSPVALFSSGV